MTAPREALLRPDQAAAAVAMAGAGAAPAAVAEALGVPVEVVLRSVRWDRVARAASEVAAPVAVPLAVTRADVQLQRVFGGDPGPDAGLDPLPDGGSVFGPVLRVGPVLSVRRLPRPQGWRAPVFVEDDLSWPPPASADDCWRLELVVDGKSRERVPLREVLLWSEQVLVDDERRVFCPVCCALVEVVALGRDLFRGEDQVLGGGTASHRLGLPAVRPVSGR